MMVLAIRHFEPNFTAFTLDEPPDWFMCVFYPPAFPRQHAQQGVYTLTARFGRDHADAIAVKVLPAINL